uniref:Odorant receptor n=1 Tax=Bradysia odoriphaga TaxID=1564500 RepID=A0A6B9CBP6_9DIPT|nr:odorant receptor 52 [Bradysia odoriphaga]
MFYIKVHRTVKRIISLFYYIGFWHRRDEETARERKLQLLYLFYFCLFPLLLAAGAVTTGNQSEKTFLIEVTTITSVLQLKLWYIIWKREEILEHLNQICDYRIVDREAFTEISKKLTDLMKFVKIFLATTYICAVHVALVAPFLGTERKPFFNIPFPSDWKDTEFAFWTRFFFIATQQFLSANLVLFGAIVWYLMANCAWQYEVLGQRISKMGEMRTTVEESTDERPITDTERDNLYCRDLIEIIKSHNHVKRITNQLDVFLSKLFVVQLATSSLCICASTYSIAFFSGDNFFELLVYLTGLLYSIFDIFMIMFFANEITLASDRLSYRLYESCWIDRRQSIKRNVLLFGEFLVKPHQLIVLQLYPLTLDTFTRILNSAYSMFNILQNFK